MHPDHNDFRQALLTKKKMKITYYDFDRNEPKTIVCAPLSYGSRQRRPGWASYYHFCEIRENNGIFAITLSSGEILRMEMTDEDFGTFTILLKMAAQKVVSNAGLSREVQDELL